MDSCAVHVAVGALAVRAIGVRDPAYGAYTDYV